MLPNFDKFGNLPAGIHTVDWQTLSKRFGHSDKRKFLLRGMHQALLLLKDAGCKSVYVDGSFVTSKDEPGDFDNCWDATEVNFDLLDPIFRIDEDPSRRDAQKTRFGGELYPAQIPSVTGATILDFFQMDRQGRPKGIVQLDLNVLPVTPGIKRVRTSRWGLLIFRPLRR